jgi:hypothetical protein
MGCDAQNDEEDQRDDQEVHDGLEEQAPSKSDLFLDDSAGFGIKYFGFVDILEVNEGFVTGDKTNEGVDEGGGEFVDDILEGIRNNYTDRHVNDVAAGDKGFKVFEETRGLILDFLFHEFFPF